MPLLFSDPSHVALLESSRDPISEDHARQALTRPIGHKGAQLIDLVTSDMQRIAELGPGFGQHLQRLHDKDPGRELLGIEISPEIAFVANKISSFPYLLAEAEHIPIPDETFDMVFSVAAFSHFQDINAVISEMRRILKSDGKALIITENPLFIAYRIQFIFGKWSGFSSKMGRHFVNSMATMKEWITIFRDHGFELEKNLSNIVRIRENKKSLYLGSNFGNLLAKHFAFCFAKK